MRSLGSGTTNVGHVHAWYKVTDCLLFAFSLLCFPLLFPQFRTQATGIPSFSLRELRPRVSKTVFNDEASASTPLSDSSTLRIRYLLLKQPPKNFQTLFHWGSRVELICITDPRSCKILNVISAGRRSSPDAKTVARELPKGLPLADPVCPWTNVGDFFRSWILKDCF